MLLCLRRELDLDRLLQDSYLLSDHFPTLTVFLLGERIRSSGLTAGPYLGSELAKLALGQPIELDLNDYDVAGAIE